MDKGDDNKELCVQVGEHTQIFKYGDKESQKSNLINDSISIFNSNRDVH